MTQRKRAKAPRKADIKDAVNRAIVASAAKERPKGAQTVYSRELADLILGRMANGETVNQICRDLKAQGVSISAPTVRLWVLDDRDGFAERYARARDMMFDYWAEEQVDIADDASNDWMVREGKDGENLGWQVNGDHIQRSKLRIDTRKWLLSKLKPERYGEKVAVDHGGKVEQVHTEAPQSTGEDHMADITQRFASKVPKPNGHANGKANGSVH